MIIEPARPDDSDAVAALVNGAYRGERAETGWTTEAGYMTGRRTDAATVRATVEGGSATVLLLRREAGGALLGCVSVEPLADGAWYLSMLSIDPARQADGLGRRLLDAGEDFARRRGGTRVRITVIQVRDTLIAWYERRGYRRTGETEPFPYGDERFGVPLRPDLYFVVFDKPLSPGSA